MKVYEGKQHREIPEFICECHFPRIISWISYSMSESINEIHSLHIEKTSRKIHRIKISFCIIVVLKLLHFQKSSNCKKGL